MTTAALFLLLFGCLFIGVPVAVSLGLASIATILLFAEDSLASMAQKLFETLSEHDALLAIPLFILSSAFLATGGVAARLVRFATAVVGHLRGGPAMASVLACLLFAALPASSPSTVATTGAAAIPGMVRLGYPKAFAIGVIAAAGTLATLVPPSILLLVYTAATEVSAARLFMAGLVPGIMIALLLTIAVYLAARRLGLPAELWPGRGARFRSLFPALGGIVLIVVVLGAIFSGITSPSEAAALSAVYAFLAAVYGYRDIGPLKAQPWRHDSERFGRLVARNLGLIVVTLPRLAADPEIKRAVMDAAKVSIMLLFLIANATLFAQVLNGERIPQVIAEGIVASGLPAWAFLLIVNLLLLAAGNFMAPAAVLLITAPILFPVARQLGIDPLHLGIIMVVNMAFAMLAPAVGLNLFVAAGMTGESLPWAMRAALPWLLVLLVALLLVTYAPQITLFLPELIDHRP